MFKPGVSGNPSGRPKMPDELKEKITAGAAEGFEFWLKTLRNEDASWAFRDKAAEKLVAYKYGKPREVVDVDVNGSLEIAQASFTYVDPPTKTIDASSEEV